MYRESIGAIILPPRLVATGDPAGQALENINTNVLGNGALCYVAEGPGQGEWQLQKEATDAPDGVTIVAPISGPGRWFIKLFPGPGGGGGGGGVTSVVGSDGITTTNPAGPVVTVNGTNLLPLDGSRAMTGALDMGTNGIANASTGAFSGAVTGATFNGVALTTGGAATDFLNAQGNYVSVSAAPADPVRSIQFNNAGAFDGSASMIFDSDGTGSRAIVLSSGAGTATEVGLRLRESTGPTEVGSLYYDEVNGQVQLTAETGTLLTASSDFFNLYQSIAPDPIQYRIDLKSPGAASVDGTIVRFIDSADGLVGSVQGDETGKLTVLGGVLALDAGTELLWPTADGSANDVMVTDGAGQLSLASISTIATPTLTIQSTGVSANATDTFNTFVRCTANSITITLPAPTTPGKTIRVKDVTGTAGGAPANAITVNATGGASIDGAATYLINTNWGSATFISNGATWDVV